MKKFSYRHLLVGALISLSACLPRGESRSLEEVFTLQRTTYLEKTRSSNLPGDVGEKLKSITGTLDMLAGLNPATTSPVTVGSAADDLQSLSTRCNYTVRPSLAELVEQMRGLEKDGRKVNPGAPEPKLLAARVYNILSSEMTTSKFSIS